MQDFGFNNQPTYRLNSFRIDGLSDVDCSYRIVRVIGLIDDDTDVERKMALLCRLLKSELHVVAEPLQIAAERLIGVCAFTPECQDIILPQTMRLTPELVKLSWHTNWARLDIRYGESIAERKLLDTCLKWALDRAVRASGEWWQFGKRYVSKRPDPQASNTRMNGHPAFYYGFLPGQDKRPELVLDPSVCFISPRSIDEESGGQVPKWIKGQHLLYEFESWYSIDALGVGGPASTVQFEDSRGGGLISLHDFVARESRKPSLNPGAFAIQYKTSGEKTRYAHSSLLYRLPLANNMDNDTRRDRESIMPAEVRGAKTEAFVRALDGRLCLFGVPLRLPFKCAGLDDRRCFSLPPPSSDLEVIRK